MPWVPCTHPDCDDSHYFPDDAEIAAAQHLWRKRSEERAGTCDCTPCRIKRRRELSNYSYDEYVYVLEDGTVVWWTTNN